MNRAEDPVCASTYFFCCPGWNPSNNGVCGRYVASGIVCCPFCWTDFFYSRDGLVNIVQNRMLATLPADADVRTKVKALRREAYRDTGKHSNASSFMQDQVRKARQHNIRWDKDEEYRKKMAKEGWIWGMKGRRTEPWEPFDAKEEPPVNDLLMSDTDVFTIIGLQVIGTGDDVILERGSDEYKCAIAHLEYGMNLKKAFVLQVVEAESEDSFEEVSIEMAKDAKARCLTSSAVRKPSGKGVWEPEPKIFEHWLRVVCTERIRRGIWMR